MPKAIPIITYSKDHTGPKIQPGGLKLGFIKVRYQVEVEGLTDNPETIPRARHKKANNIS
jgi:hypothetical protein